MNYEIGTRQSFVQFEQQVAPDQQPLLVSAPWPELILLGTSVVPDVSWEEDLLWKYIRVKSGLT